jgi:DNA modification methylase
MAELLGGEYELVGVDQLVTHPRNPRRGDVRVVGQSIQINGFYGAVVAQRSTGHVLAGNHRLLAARQAGLAEVPVIWVDVDDDEALRILLADNRTADLATYDDRQLSTLLADLAATEQGYQGTGYDQEALDELLAKLQAVDVAAHQRGHPDDVPPTPAEPLTQPGDLWLLGPHRLLCGDASSVDDVGRLFNGATPRLMVTDPPYGVSYDPAWRQKAAAAGHLADAARRVGEVPGDGPDADWEEALGLFPGDVAYVWAGAQTCRTREWLEAIGFEVRATLIWAKRHFPISRGAYHWRHEPCWYAVRKGKSAGWIGGRDQTTLWDDITLDSNVEGGHSTQKPVECMARPLRNHSGDVYDPFVGSGTTVVAAQMAGRVAYAMEISPAYADVTARRYQRLTAGVPVLEATGAAHDFEAV